MTVLLWLNSPIWMKPFHRPSVAYCEEKLCHYTNLFNVSIFCSSKFHLYNYKGWILRLICAVNTLKEHSTLLWLYTKLFTSIPLGAQDLFSVWDTWREESILSPVGWHGDVDSNVVPQLGARWLVTTIPSWSADADWKWVGWPRCTY